MTVNFPGAHYHYHESNSTNELAQDFVTKNHLLTSPVLFTSDFQIEGKGYDNNRWESEAGKNILASIIISPDFLNAIDQFNISIIISFAICDTLESHNIRNVSIKWPNDIYVGDQKICGILIRHKLFLKTIKNSIIGFGLNVNQDVFSAAIPNPTSFKLQTSANIERSLVLNEVLSHFFKYYDLLKINQPLTFHKAYEEKMYRINQYHQYVYQGKELTAKITGINEFGFLCLESRSGQSFECDLKEIEYLI